MLDHVPARLRVIRICRPRYGCRACGTIHQAPAPERPIAKGLASPALLAHVLVAKYCDHLPLYRQSQIFARHGVELDRSTLANWVGGACWWLEPLQARLAEHVFADAIRYALTRWSDLSRFLDDGRIELDTNTVERTIRPSHSVAKTTCSPDPIAGLRAGRPSAPLSPPQSSTTSSPSPISRTFSNTCPPGTPWPESTSFCHGIGSQMAPLTSATC